MTDLRTLSETDTAAPDETSDRKTFRASTLDEAVAAARSELGPEVELIEAHRIRRGGLGGFFATDLGVEIVAAARPASHPGSSLRQGSTVSAGAGGGTGPLASMPGDRVTTGLDRLIEDAETSESIGVDRSSDRGSSAGETATGTGEHPFDRTLEREMSGAAAGGAATDGPVDRFELGADPSTPVAAPDLDPPTGWDAPASPIDETIQTIERPTPDPIATPTADTAAERPADPRHDLLVDPFVDLGVDVDVDDLDLDPAPAEAASLDDPVTDPLEPAAESSLAAPIDQAPQPAPFSAVAESERIDVGDAEVIDVDADDDDDLSAAATADVGGSLDEIDALLRGVGVNVPALRDEARMGFIAREVPALPVDDVARIAVDQLVDGITALDERCAGRVRRVSVSVTTNDGTTVCMSTELTEDRGG